MKDYDIKQPLIFIHIPKAAGTTTRQVFQRWYGRNLLTHYYDERKGKMPRKYDIVNMHSIKKPIIVYGHFNKERQFGVEDYYPQVQQFITILRDPFELTLSHYFYLKKVARKWKDKQRVPTKGVTEYMLSTKPNMLNHFPREVTFSNFKEIIEQFFIVIGIAEYLNESLMMIAGKLNMPYKECWLEYHNRTERDEEISPDLRDVFVEKNPLEFEVYNYALERFCEQRSLQLKPTRK